MIERKTVLLLGAGASIDFKFPTGWELQKSLAAGFTSEQLNCLMPLGFSHQKCTRFSTALAQSGVMSVDAFLSGRPDLVEIGKAGIAISLVPYEKPSRIYEGKDPTWMHILLDRMRASHSQWSENKLSIVTFNYDRVVEFFLHNALVNRFSMGEAEALAFRKKVVPIVHVHGQLGEFIDDSAGAARPFRADLNPQEIAVAADGIKIIHEGDAAQEAFQTARKLLGEAEEIVVMGFGFDETNLERLNASATMSGKDVYAAGVGMTDRQAHYVTRRGGLRFGLSIQFKSLSEFLRNSPALGH